MAEETVTGETQEVPIGEANMAEYKKARAEGKEVVEREAAPPAEELEATEGDKGEDGKPKPKTQKSGVQARIDRLVKQQALAEERATAAEKRAAEAEAKLTAPKEGTVQKTEQAPEGEPQRENFQTEAEYVRALTRWEVKQELKAEREAEDRAAAAADAREAVSAYNRKAIEAQAQHDDWNEVFKQDINIPTIVGDAIIHTIKNGPEVAYYLGKHPEICQEMINVGHPLEAVTMAIKISEQLEKEQPEETDEEREDRERIEAEEAEATKVAARRRAPAPIKPVSGGSSRSTIPLDKASFSDYKKLRSQGRVR